MSFLTVTVSLYTTLILTSVSALILCVVTGLLGRSSHSRRWPPGPPSKPIIGNILQVSPEGAWTKFTEYKERYGDLVFFHGLGNHVLVLNSLKVINDLLDKRSAIYSNRPCFTVVGELMNLDKSMPLLPYGKEWRSHRRLAHTALSPTAVKRYHTIQEDLAALLCQQMLQTPGDFFNHVRLISGKIIMSIAYGLPVETAEDEYISHAEKTMIMIGKATVPGAYLADLLPILKYAPSWVPFQKQVKIGRNMIEHLITQPFEHVKREMYAGKAPPSLTQDLLSSADSPELDHRVKWTVGAMYGAGSESTYSTVLVFIMAMALHPEKQHSAQRELDQVIGADRFPSISDLPRLPYVGAVIREVMRWHPVLPLSIARMTASDDEYGGYFIPKGTIVIPNVWAVAFEAGGEYDEQDFVPERFLHAWGASQAVDPSSWAFGFAKRICPGKYLAENSLFILIAALLSVFDISPDPEEPLKPLFSPHLVSYPKPFRCRIVPRSAAHATMINLRASASSST